MRAIDYINKHGLDYCKKYIEETENNPYLGTNFWVYDNGDTGFHINALRELVDLYENGFVIIKKGERM